MLGVMADSYNAPAVGGSWVPTDITGLQVWFDASDTATITSSGGAVSAWADKSGNSRTASQATGANQPITGTRTLNGLNALDFSATDFMATGNITLPQPFTALALVQFDNLDTGAHQIFGTSSASIFIRTNVGSWGYATGTNVNFSGDDGNPHVFAGIFNSPASAMYMDGAGKIAGSTTGANGWVATPFYISHATSSWDGIIAEIFVYNSVLSTADRQAAIGYLQTKWNLVAQSPTDIAGLQGWWDASDTATITESAGSVSQWNDKSGNGRDVTQATGTSQPSTGVATLNGKNVLTFDGVADCLAGATTQLVNATTGEWTSFVVAKSTATGGSQNMFSQDSGVAGRVANFIWVNSTNVYSNAFNTAGAAVQENVGSFNTTTIYVFDSVRGATTCELFMNGISNGASATTGTPAAGTGIFRIGASGAAAAAGFWNGVIGEVIVYNTALSINDRQKVENYLFMKWCS